MLEPVLQVNLITPCMQNESRYWEIWIFVCIHSFFFFFSCALKVQYDEKLDLLSLHLRLNRLLSGCWGLERSGGWFYGRR